MALTRLRSPDAAVRWLREWVTGALRTDSRLVQPGDAFIAWPGHAVDGRQFARAALVAGASTCLVERDDIDGFAFDDARIASLPQLKAATGLIADAWFEQPSASLDVIAATGTNGKTSSAWWIAQALALLGRRCGVIGTLGIGEPPVVLPGGAQPPPAEVDPAVAQLGTIVATGLTTPDPVRLHEALRRFVDGGIQACAIEASSIGIEEHRLDGLRIRTALLTNFTPDHLDYHGSMEAYWAAKRRLFHWPGLRAAVLNIDDPHGAALAAELAAGRSGPELWTVAVEQPARLVARALDYGRGALGFELHEGRDVVRVQTRLIGDYNASNLLGVVAALRTLGVSLADAATLLPWLTPVPGRMQRIEVTGGDGAVALPEVVVDYAHTPDALDKALGALRPFAAARGGRLVAVFGCGGNRDASKRAPMGAIAARLADRVLLTSDNPRGEPPSSIIEQIAAGISGDAGHVGIEPDRRTAIARAIAEADGRDVVLLAGKGHEDYQEIAGERLPFSDAVEAVAALRRRAGVDQSPAAATAAEPAAGAPL